MIIIRAALIALHVVVQLTRYAAGRLLGLPLIALWPRARRRVRARRLAARCLTSLLRNLGATFIKVGQILSARPDLLPRHYVEELETLQDQVPAFDGRRARAIIEAELGRPIEDVFARFDPVPIAAASIAQVHRAELRGGARVALKVQRPKIQRTMRRDLTILRLAARAVHLLPWLRNLQLPRMAGEFAGAIEAQLDFVREVANNRQFERNFAHLPHVGVPRVFSDLSTEKVITMEFVEAAKLTDAVASPPVPRSLLAERIMDLYYQMAFGDLFVHADLHPGNVLIDKSGKIILIDTGLVYRVPKYYARKFIRVAAATTTLDGRMILEAYLEGLDVDAERRSKALADAEALAKRYADRRLSDLELGRVFVEMLTLLRRNGIYMDAEWTVMALSDITFEGIAKMLDADIDFLAIGSAKVAKYAMAHNAFTPGEPLLQAILDRVAPPLASADRSAQ